MLSLTMDLSVEYSQLATRSLSGLGLSSIVCVGGGKRPQFNPSTFVALVRTGLPTRPQCVQDLHKCQRTAQSGRLVLEVTQSLAHDAARTARR